MNFLEIFGFELRDNNGVWLCVDDCGNEREATLNERVLWGAIINFTKCHVCSGEEIDLKILCHNSKCSCYGEEKTIFEGRCR